MNPFRRLFKNGYFSDGLWDVLSQSDVSELIGAYLEEDKEVYETNAATMLIRRAIGESWDGKSDHKICQKWNFFLKNFLSKIENSLKHRNCRQKTFVEKSKLSVKKSKLFVKKSKLLSKKKFRKTGRPWLFGFFTGPVLIYSP